MNSTSFYTSVHISKLKSQIGYEQKSFFIGSCFADSIAERMQYHKFAVSCNPFGVLYNPVSLLNALKMMGKKRTLREDELRFQDGLWFSYTHHSKFSYGDKTACLQRINQSIHQGAWGLRTADFLIITLGSAQVYRLKNTGEVVANCHKTSNTQFETHLMSVAQVQEALEAIMQIAKNVNPSIKMIFTVSPIRYSLADMHQSQLSKATLLLGLQKAMQNQNNCSYFPAYEIMLDELRDYRFYKSDLRHPNKTAVEYIWQKFMEFAISPDTKKIMQKVAALIAVKQHRPFNANGSGYAALLNKQLKALEDLANTYPHIDWQEEFSFFAPRKTHPI
ncbi:MAG: GSCFA domain-containing protein [Bacteroidales bacterium]